ncbi:MAG: hemerythrin, partial [Calditrichaeota bacterium]|nr:hemerythrin [Calditrichota bacterium]
ADAAERLKDGDASAAEAVIENARNYSALLSQHIQKENNILYPMANQILSEEDQQNLQREFERVENDVVGKGVHEKYHRLVEELEKQMGL